MIFMWNWFCSVGNAHMEPFWCSWHFTVTIDVLIHYHIQLALAKFSNYTMEPVKSGKKRCSSSRSDDFSNQLIIKDHVRRTQFTVNWMVSKRIVVEFPVKGSFDWKLSCNMLNNSFFNCLDRLSYIRVNHQSTDCHCWNSFSRESSKSGLILWHNVESTS